jgi:hypothetical protein
MARILPAAPRAGKGAVGEAGFRPRCLDVSAVRLMIGAMNTWVGIEVSRQLRLVDGELAPPGGMTLAGVNLLERQIQHALELTSPEQVCILTPQGDGPTLELIGRYEVRELAPMDFIAMLADRVKQGDEGAVVLLRQAVPLRDTKDVQQALKLLRKHAVVVSASRPPADHPRAKPRPEAESTEPDLRCLAFEVRRMAQFSLDAGAGLGGPEPHELMIEWESFGEIIRPEDEAHVATLLEAWR